jgi:hypothetical protein
MVVGDCRYESHLLCYSHALRRRGYPLNYSQGFGKGLLAHKTWMCVPRGCSRRATTSPELPTLRGILFFRGGLLENLAGCRIRED